MEHYTLTYRLENKKLTGIKEGIMGNVIDYTEKIDCIMAFGKNRNVLILQKLDKKFKRFDGKLATYQLEHRWLSCDCQNENDQAYVCVQGNDFTYWQQKEIKDVLSGKIAMFDFFKLF
jgi:hypothetical protein